jgi:molybdate transport system substrate-binding protein
MTTLQILGDGVAQRFVSQLCGNFTSETGSAVESRFGALAQVRDRLLAGEPCDVLVVSQPLIEELTVAGRVLPGSVKAVGLIRAGLAVRAGVTVPRVETADTLRAALLAADTLYFPDPETAPAGAHLLSLLQRLGIAQELRTHLRPCASGAEALQTLMQDDQAASLAYAQVSEIQTTAGVQIAGILPRELAWTTMYAAAVTTRARHPQVARQLIDRLSAPSAAALRRAGGFE